MPGGIGGGDPGVQREATSDTAGGGQNIGFIEDGDWWALDPASLTGIESIRFRAASAASRRPDRGPRRRGRRPGGRPRPTVPGTGGWQT